MSLRSPAVAAEWHPTKNGTLTAADVSYASNKRIWWHCKSGHEWDARIESRSRGNGCPYCAGRYVTDDNRLSLKASKLIQEWHPTKNGNLTPADVAVASNKRVWWHCENGHEWESLVNSRTDQGQGCPYCAGKRVSDVNSLSVNHPDIAKEWHPTKNGTLMPDEISYGSNKKVWWLCERGHEWEASPNHRKSGRGCPFCSRRRVSHLNRLSLNYPKLVPEWHPTKNGTLTPDTVSYGSNKKVWWLCERGHEWEAVISSRTLDVSGCPYCKGNIVSDANRLSIHRLDIAKEWHPHKNGDLTPGDVAVASNKKVWWRCERGHEWEAVIPSRTLNRRGCPYCAGQRVTDGNRLSLNAPDELIQEWHPTKNGNLTPDDVSYGSDKKIWWICEREHEWKAAINSRYHGSGCRSCTLPHRSKVEIRLACELATFFDDIDPTQTYKVTTLEDKSLEVDIVIPSERLVIEYDGSYWHEGKLNTDIQKTKALESAGWDVLRIREEPLELVLTTDLQCPATLPYDIKDLADRVLVNLDEEFGIEIPSLGEYLMSNSLANEDAANDIIADELSNRQKTDTFQQLPLFRD